MKKTILKISVGFFAAILLLSGFYAFADDSTQTTLNPFSVISGYIKARSATNGLQIPSLSATTTDTTLHADATGKFYLGAGGSGGGSSTTINSLLGPAFTIAAGSNVTVATSAPNTITISASGGGSTTTTISGVVGPNFTLQGTTNQVNVATSTGTITLSLPQDIATVSTPQFAKIKTAVIFPAADSVQGVQINKADGTTNVLNVDTTNGRVGIDTTSPSQLLTVGNNNQFTVASSGLLTIKQAKNNPYISLQDTGTTDWRIHLGNESVPNIYIGGLTQADYFWRANWNTAGVAGNTFQVPNTSNNANTVVEILQKRAGNTGDYLHITSNGAATGNILTVANNGNVGIATTTPNATLHVYGSNAFKYTKLATSVSTYNIATSTDNTIYISTTTAASTINLPSCQGNTDQIEYIVKDLGGNAGTNNITVTATAGNTIDGASTKVINSNYGSTKVQCVSGSGWFVLP